jgi:pantetheine-phosphate adenylyltransferase
MRLLFPGSFDPPHFGHVDLIRRAAAHGPLLVGVAVHPEKAGLLPVERRVALLRRLVADLPVEVAAYSGATVAFAREQRITVLVRGLRHGQDLEAERPLAVMNRQFGLETLFLLADPAHVHVSSSTVRAVRAAGLPLDSLIPAVVAEALP